MSDKKTQPSEPEDTVAVPEVEDAPVESTEPSVDPSPRTITLTDFARMHGRMYGWPLMGGFMAELESRGQLTGKESDLLAQLAQFAQRAI